MIFTVRKTKADNTACWENSTARIRDLIKEHIGKVSGKLKEQNTEIKELKSIVENNNTSINSKIEEISKKISEEH